MRNPTASELLSAWERGLSQSAAHRALTLLALADSGTSVDRLAAVTIGVRDALLLDLRERLFGSDLNGQAFCPACGLSLELNLTLGELRISPPPVIPETLTVTSGEYEIESRLPNSADLADLPPAADPALVKQTLLQRCVLRAQHAGSQITSTEVPEEVATVLSDRMAQADPQADVQLSLVCPQCAHCWQSPLDIVSFLWSEIHAWALRLLRDVHALASAYGWHEADILAMTPSRRTAYLDLIGA